MSQKILVTGGAGYLGSTLVPELLQKGYSVTVFDNFMWRENSLAHVCHHPKFSVIRGDIRDTSALKKAVSGHDAVIPLAALVGAPICDQDPFSATAINRDATISMFKMLSPLQWVIMPTTNSGYGTGQGAKPLTEEAPLNPISLYAKHKVEVEEALLDHANSISFRLATVFGMSPRMRIDLLVNEFAYRAVYDRCLFLFEAHFKRNYLHVRDVTRAFVFGLENFDRIRGQVFNVGLSEANLSKKELAMVIQKVLPNTKIVEVETAEDPDKRNYVVSNEKIERAGFKTQHSLELGIVELVKGFTMIKNTRFGNV